MTLRVLGTYLLIALATACGRAAPPAEQAERQHYLDESARLTRKPAALAPQARAKNWDEK